MALIDFEGFDKETNLALSNWWTGGVGSGSVQPTGAFNYGRYINGPYGNFRTIPLQSVLWMNVHVKLTIAPNGDIAFVFGNGASINVWISWNASLKLICSINGGATQTTNGAVIALGAWYFVQIRLYIHPTVGTVQVYIQGTLVYTFTGNTDRTSTGGVDRWSLFSGGPFLYDNIILYNETGAAPNAKTPETRIFAELPTGAGATTAWTPSAGANWQNVDEEPNDGDTTYNSAAAAGLDDLYAFPASQVPAATTIYAVASEIVARKDDAGLNNIDTLIKSGATTYANGDTFGLTSTFQRFRSIMTTDPATGAAWTVSAANAAQLGIRRTL